LIIRFGYYITDTRTLSNERFTRQFIIARRIRSECEYDLAWALTNSYYFAYAYTLRFIKQAASAIWYFKWYLVCEASLTTTNIVKEFGMGTCHLRNHIVKQITMIV